MMGFAIALPILQTRTRISLRSSGLQVAGRLRSLFDITRARECAARPGLYWHVSRHPEAAAKRPSKGDGRGAGAVHPSRLAELVIGPATSGRTRWLAPQDDGGMLGASIEGPPARTTPPPRAPPPP